MDTIKYNGEVTDTLPDDNLLGPAASMLADLTGSEEYARLEGDPFYGAPLSVPVVRIAQRFLELGIAADARFTTYAGWMSEDVNATHEVSSRIFIEALANLGYPEVRVPIHKLLAHARVVAEIDNGGFIADECVYQVLCAYYSSFDSRFQAVFYPAPYTRYAASDYIAFDFSGFAAEFVRRMAISRLSMNAVWTGLNLEGWKAPNLFLDFMRRTGEKEILPPGQSQANIPGSFLSDIVDGEPGQIDACLHDAEKALLPTYSPMCASISTQQGLENMVMDAIPLSTPSPASLSDVASVFLENFAAAAEQKEDLEKLDYYRRLIRQWNDYCQAVAMTHDTLASRGRSKGRIMPTVSCDSEAAGLLLLLYSKEGLPLTSAISSVFGYELSELDGKSLLSRTRIGQDVEVVRLLVAHAAYLKAQFCEDERISIAPEDILFAVKIASSRDNFLSSPDNADVPDYVNSALRGCIFPSALGIPDAVMFGASRGADDTITVESTREYVNSDRFRDKFEIPLGSISYRMDISAVRLYTLAYLVEGDAVCQETAGKARALSKTERYADALLAACALEASIVLDEASFPSVSDTFYICAHERPFDASDVRIMFLAPEDYQQLAKKLPRPATAAPYKQPLTVRSAPNLEMFCEDLTVKAQRGEIGVGIIERDDVMDSIERALRRRDKSSPVLVAPAGTGKTAVVEALAKRIAEGKAKTPSRKLMALNLSSLVENANENVLAERIESIVKEAIASRTVLFIDEIHTITSIGKREFNLANMMKPHLARSGLMIIGASTETEYNATIAKSRSLNRRFVPIRVPALDFNQIVRVLDAKKGQYGQYHGVVYSDKAVKTMALMAQDYMSNRPSPDRELDIMDAAGVAAGERNSRTVDEQDVVQAVKELTANGHVRTRRQLVAEAIDDSEGAANGAFDDIAGQQEAKKEIVERIAASKLGIASTTRPKNIFLFAGESGCGKTYTAHQMAKLLDLSEEDVLEIALGNFQSHATYTMLVGAPPSYIGYEDGGMLVDFVTSHPNGIVILDEIDKCAPEIRDMFLGIFDTGSFRAGNGMMVDCTSVTFVCTANTGFGADKRSAIGFGAPPDKSSDRKDALDKIKQKFGAPLVSRIDSVVFFDELGEEDYAQVCAIAYGKMSASVSDRYDIELEEIISLDDVVDSLSGMFGKEDTDAREVTRAADAKISNAVFEALSREA